MKMAGITTKTSFILKNITSTRILSAPRQFSGFKWFRKGPAQVSTAKVLPYRKAQDGDSEKQLQMPHDFRIAFPEFLPDPKPEWRNRLREKLERHDMLARRAIMEIPEFYVGSIMAVSVGDPNASGKTNRFVGICIQRGGTGLRSWFILRNVIDHQGIEIRYEMYSPLIQNIEVLRLEKRLDDELLYLRDALPEYSTFPLDMIPEILQEGAPVPINPLKVQLRGRPWHRAWFTDYSSLVTQGFFSQISICCIEECRKVFGMPPVGGHSVAAGRVASETTRSQIDYARIYARTHPRGPSPFNSRTPLVERPELINALHLPFERVPVSVERDGTCPHCGLDDMTRMYPTWSKIAACLLFPFGLMFMCFNYEDRCPTCNYLSPR